MANRPVEIEYNADLKKLCKLMGSVDRAGDYVHFGSCICPLPRIDIGGVGTLAFPLLDAQADSLAAAAEQAPYGRGPDTILDTSVRNTRRIPPDRIRIESARWEETLAGIVEEIRLGLGCSDRSVEARLYKMLIYPPGGFIAVHRDTEKEDRMFATLVLALPSFFEGGDLIVSHKAKQKRYSLSATDVSELRYAAFYADCEHEVLPVAISHTPPDRRT